MDTHAGGPHTLSDVKFSRTMHASEPDAANKPECTMSQATYHLPVWAPGAPLWEQPGNPEGSSVLPSSAFASSKSLNDNVANIHRRQRSRSAKFKASTGSATDAPIHASISFNSISHFSVESVHADYCPNSRCPTANVQQTRGNAPCSSESSSHKGKGLRCGRRGEQHGLYEPPPYNQKCPPPILLVVRAPVWLVVVGLGSTPIRMLTCTLLIHRLLLRLQLYSHASSFPLLNHLELMLAMGYLLQRA